MDQVRLVVLDDVDTMLSKGFHDSIYTIFQSLSCNVQSLVLANSLPHDEIDIIAGFMRDPLRIVVDKEAITLEVSG